MIAHILFFQKEGDGILCAELLAFPGSTVRLPFFWMDSLSWNTGGMTLPESLCGTARRSLW